MNLEEMHYDAFISYRHCDLDMFVAQNLHKKLESFKLPSSILKTHPDLPRKIKRVFRDQEELPLASNLADPITVALKNSDNLIVICTPRLKESLWCKKEIETFIAMHGREHVFAVLAEGEPSESFPEELLVNEKGELVEPLAADFRGSSKSEMAKKMKTEILRLIAPMFGLNFDDLRQRHKEQRIKRIMAAGAVIMAALIAFGIYISITALKIKRQADEIASQNEMITLQNEEITQKSEELEIQYAETRRKYATIMSTSAMEIAQTGRRKDALYAIRSVLPDKLPSEEIPYVPEAYATLNDILGEYYPLGIFQAAENYPCSASVRKMMLSPNGSRIMIFNAVGGVEVFDTDSGEKVYEFNPGMTLHNSDAVEFLTDDEIFLYDSEGEFIYNLETEKKDYIAEGNCTVHMFRDEGYVIIESVYEIKVLDIESKKEVFRKDVDIFGDMGTYEDAAFSDDGQQIGIVFYKALSVVQGQNELQVFDFKSGELLSKTTFDPGMFLGSMCYGDGVFYFGFSKEFDFSRVEGYVIAVDAQSGKQLYKSESYEIVYRNMKYVNSKGYRRLVANSYSGAYALNPDDGLVDTFCDIGDRIIAFDAYNEGLSRLIVDTNGDIFMFDVLSGTVFQFFDYAVANSDRVQYAIYFEGDLYLFNQGYDYITKYDSRPNDNAKQIAEYNGSLTAISANGRIGLDSSYEDRMYVYSIQNYDTGEVFNSEPTEMTHYWVSRDGSRVLIYSKGYTLYNTEDMSVAASYIIPEDEYELITGVSTDGRILVAQTDDEEFRNIIVTYDAATAQRTVTDIVVPKDATSLYDWAISDSGDKYYIMDRNKVKVYLVTGEDKGTKITYEATSGVIAQTVLSQDEKYLFVRYENGVLEILDSNTMENVKTLYGYTNLIKAVDKYDSLEGYLIRAQNGYWLDENLDRVSSFKNFVGYDENADSFISKDLNENIVAIPRLSYDDVIKRTDKLLKGYTPKKQIVEQYGLVKEEQ